MCHTHSYSHYDYYLSIKRATLDLWRSLNQSGTNSDSFETLMVL